jgi:hypothetical protein
VVQFGSQWVLFMPGVTKKCLKKMHGEISQGLPSWPQMGFKKLFGAYFIIYITERSFWDTLCQIRCPITFTLSSWTLTHCRIVAFYTAKISETTENECEWNFMCSSTQMCQEKTQCTGLIKSTVFVWYALFSECCEHAMCCLCLLCIYSTISHSSYFHF